jgi:hypothetical protein
LSQGDLIVSDFKFALFLKDSKQTSYFTSGAKLYDEIIRLKLIQGTYKIFSLVEIL